MEVTNQGETKRAQAFEKFCNVVERLRGPGGCPWDLEQTPLTLRGDLIEETYECIEAIDEQNPDHIKEELGDLFLIITMLTYMHEQERLFTITDALNAIAAKLIRRHPHVFTASPDGALSPDEALKNWAKIKVEQEGRKPKDSLLDEVSRGLPPLERAWKLQKKAAKAGFDWPDAGGVIEKIKEELKEVEAAIKSPDGTLEAELGDLLFSVVNLCRFFNAEPSLALSKTNNKFTERFKHVEKRMKESGQEMKAENLDTMEEYWIEAKGLGSRE